MLAPWKKFHDQTRQQLKSRDITLPTKFYLVKAMVFPVVMYGCKRWAIKKGECRKIDASELWWWRRLLRVHWTGKRSNQSILEEISPEYLLEGLMLKLKLQYFGHLMQRADSFRKKPWCWERLKAGGKGDARGCDDWMAPLTQWTWVWASSWSWWWTGNLACCSPWGHKESDMTEWLNWTELNSSASALRLYVCPNCWYGRKETQRDWLKSFFLL